MYCTSASVKQALSDQDMSDTVLALLIPAVCSGIDKYCHRTFEPVTETRAYDLEDTRIVRLRDDLVSITSVTTNAEQTFTAADFLLEPRSGPPYRWLKLKVGKTFYYSGTTEEAISITGAWGYKATVPTEVTLAAKLWAGILYNQMDVLGFESVNGGELSAKLVPLTDAPPAQILALISPLRHISIRSAR